MGTSVGIGGEYRVDLRALVRVAREESPVHLDASARAKMAACHAFFAGKVESRIPIYGLNTQFGDQVVLLDKHMDDYETEQYQNSLQNRQNSLIRSHNCGMGEPVASEIVRGAMLLRGQCLSMGYSGVRPEAVETLSGIPEPRDHAQLGYRYGSIGASGDLVPLATIAAAVVGEDVDVRYDGSLVPAQKRLAELGLQPLRIQGREGLAPLINGTSFMSSVAGLAVHDLSRLFGSMIEVIAMTLESLYVIGAGDLPIVHQLKGHDGESRRSPP